MMNDGEPYDSQMNGEALIVGEKGDFPHGDQKLKWKSLEHRGVTFFPGYESHGVKLLFKVSKDMMLIFLLGERSRPQT